MSVLGVRPVQFLENTPVLPAVGSYPEQFNPYVQAGFLRPFYVNGFGTENDLVGDAGGGVVQFQFQFRPEADDKPIYMSFSDIVVKTTEPTSDQFVQLSASSSTEWEMASSRKVIYPVTTTTLTVHLVTPDKPVSFGKGITNDTLEMHVSFETNTLADVYEMMVKGWICDRPFLTPLTLMP